VKAWEFTYESEDGREEHRILKEAAAFLEKNRDLFPQGSLPGNPTQLAVLAVRIFRLFSSMMGKGRAFPGSQVRATVCFVKEKFRGGGRSPEFS
jgi:hypothetical protein